MQEVKVEVSARHIHITQYDLEVLFGEDYELKIEKELSQPGQFAAEEKVTVVGEKGQIENVRIVGPTRPNTQVELSMTDCYKTGVNAPIRLSGKIIGSGSAKLVGPKGEVELKDGVIVAKRHLHINSIEAMKRGVKNAQNVKMQIEGPRALVFDNVEVRVQEEIENIVAHLDTDEANAAGIKGEVIGILIV